MVLRVVPEALPHVCATRVPLGARPAAGTIGANVLAVLLVALTALVPLASAQEHNHTQGTGVTISHDVPMDGRTYVGDVSHFGVLVLGDDVSPDFHKQIHLRVTLNGVVLLETTPDSGHDYDGVNTFDVVFPSPGLYDVDALADDGTSLAHFGGTVVEDNTPRDVTLALDVPQAGSALEPVQITVTPTSGGSIVDHSDTLLEIFNGQTLVLRSHLHTHDEAQVMHYAFESQGTYTVRAVAYLSYPSAKAQPFVPLVAEKTINVGPPSPTAIHVPALDPTDPTALLPQTPENVVVTGTGSTANYTLVGTYDPYTAVGPNTQEHLDLLLMDPMTHEPVQHVDFSATLTGPLGTVFESKSLHEYDGIYEFTALQTTPGRYTLTADVEYDGWTGHIALPYTVLPPAMAVALAIPPMPAIGPETATLTGIDGLVAGKAAELAFTLTDAAGNPFPHSEIDVTALDAAGLPVFSTKLHTHDGSFQLAATFPAPGTYTIRMAPSALDPQPVLFAGSGEAGSLDVQVNVGGGPGIPGVVIEPLRSDAQASAPAAGPMTVLALVGLAALLRRR